MNKITQEEWIERFKKCHGNKYDYSKSICGISTEKICIICPEHGEFWMLPSNHARGQGCPKCVGKHMTTDIAISRAQKKHGDFYDYSKFVFYRSNEKSCIICPKHGEFWQTPNAHLSGNGCPKCKNERIGDSTRVDKETFIKRAKKKFGNSFDYANLDYKGYNNPCNLICPKHGNITLTPSEHIQYKYGCPKCSGRHLNQDDWVKRFRKKHGEFYNYDKFVFQGQDNFSIVTCPLHGDFLIKPKLHFRGIGCPQCSKEKIQKLNSLAEADFLVRAKQIHGDKYQYRDDVGYVNMHTKIDVCCQEHGWFKTIPMNFLRGEGCPICSKETVRKKLSLSNDEFKAKIYEIYGETILTDKVEYVNSRTPVKIGCKKHGYFDIIPYQLYRGNGCPKCNKLKSEKEIIQLLEEKGIEYQHEKTFDWLIYKGKQRIDFYLPLYNIGIEYQGRQHFAPVDFGNKGAEWAKKEFEEIKKRDLNKKKLCEENGIQLFYINYNEDKKIKIDSILQKINTNKGHDCV